jgi:DNA mismatch repair ATPase MutS
MTHQSIVLLNEVFSSTSLEDAKFLSMRILDMIRAKGALCVVVTFIDELACLGKEFVSVVSTVAADHPEIRTYRIVRRPADGLAYAVALAEKYGLTKDKLRERIGTL